MSQKQIAFQIAIDGPVGAGKSTVAKLVADRLGFLFIDTGAMYRSVALGMLWQALEIPERLAPSGHQAVEANKAGMKSLPALSSDAIKVWSDEELVSRTVSELEIELKKPRQEEQDGRQVTVVLNGQDVSWDIRTDLIAEGASLVSQYPVVREILVLQQQEIAADHNVVMEGRDIGTRVLPQAQLKIYLDARVEERIRRKQEQLTRLGSKQSKIEVKEALIKRDEREMNREIDPLRPATDAWIFDTTGLTVTQVVDRICREMEERRKSF